MPKYKALKSFVGRLPGGKGMSGFRKGEVYDLPAGNEWQYIGFMEPVKERSNGPKNNNAAKRTAAKSRRSKRVSKD